MSSNFSKNLTSSMGISLGGLEVVTDFLFTNPEFYESDLMDVKNSVFGQNTTKQTYEKPVRPKKTKEAIMHKFSILQYKPVIQKDEVLESPTLVGDDTDFDFDFSEEPGTALEQIEEDSEVLEANSLMQRLANINNFSNSIVDSDDIEIDSEGTDEFDIDIDDNDIDNFDNIDDINIEDDIDSEIEFEDDIDSESDDNEIDNFDSIDDINIEDDMDVESSELDLDDEELQIIGSFENDFTPATNSSTLIKDSDDELEFEDEIEDNFEDDFEELSDNNVEIDDASGDIDVDEDSFELDEDSFELDDDTLEVEDNVSQPDYIDEGTSNINDETHATEELRLMQQKFAEMEKQLHELKNAKSKESTSDIKDSVNKVSNTDSIDKLIDSAKGSKTNDNLDKYSQYSLMSVDVLYNEVKSYMIKMGVRTRAVELTALNNKFGELNIRKLIQKSYLIKIGSKGVTVGR